MLNVYIISFFRNPPHFLGFVLRLCPAADAAAGCKYT
jgi:hypothetical protein